MDTYLQIRIDKDLKEKFRKVAESINKDIPRSQIMSSIVRKLISDYIDMYEEKSGRENEDIMELRVKAKDFFSNDPNRFKKCKDTDFVKIYLNTKEKAAEFAWYKQNDDYAMFPLEKADYRAVANFLEQRGIIVD